MFCKYDWNYDWKDYRFGKGLQMLYIPIKGLLNANIWR